MGFVDKRNLCINDYNVVDKISDALLDYIESLPRGKEISTSEAFIKVFGAECFSNCSCSLGEYLIANIDFFEIDSIVKQKAPKRNLILDSSKYDNQHVGLPFNIPYVITKKSKAQERRD